MEVTSVISCIEAFIKKEMLKLLLIRKLSGLPEDSHSSTEILKKEIDETISDDYVGLEGHSLNSVKYYCLELYLNETLVEKWQFNILTNIDKWKAKT